MPSRGPLRILAALSVACQGAALVQHGQSQDSVIQKVVEMLESNRAKVAADLAVEEKEMAEYSAFCDTEIEEKTYAIKSRVRTINDLNAIIEDATAQLRGLDNEIAALGSTLSEKDRDLSANDASRKTEQSDFKSTEATLVESVDKLEDAISMVKHDTAAFLQKKDKKGVKKTDRKASAKAIAKMLGRVIDAAWVGGEDSKVLKGFIQQEQTAGAVDAEDFSLKAKHKTKGKQPEAKEGGGVMQTLEDMKTKAQETLSSTRLEEMKSEHNYQMVKQSITDAVALGQGKLSEAKSLKASTSQNMGKASGSLAEAKKTKVADSIYLTNLKQQCASTAEQWAERQSEAKAEMAALEQAKAILSEKVKVLAQKDKGFFDEDGDSTDQAPVRQKLVEHLKDLSHKFSSYALAEMASAAATDPFEKVKGIISDMVAKLMSEAAEEATQKDFCDTEQAKSTSEKADKSMRADELANRVDSARATKAALGEKVKELEAEVAAIDKATAEATRIRGEEHASYLKASKDFKDAAEAVTEAIRALKEYYNGASLAQVRSSQAGSKAPSFGGSKGDAASSIVSILETSGEEFTKMYMQAETEEKVAADEFNKIADESKLARTAASAEAQGAESELKTLDVTIAQGIEDYTLVSKELDAVLEYLDKLKPQCEQKVMTFEEKKVKREQEIEGLKEALSILDAPALVQTRKH